MNSHLKYYEKLLPAQSRLVITKPLQINDVKELQRLLKNRRKYIETVKT